jgi:uncharacterized phage protein gp47/JayE
MTSLPPTQVSSETPSSVAARMLNDLAALGYTPPQGDPFYQLVMASAELIYDVGVVAALAVMNGIFLDTASPDLLPHHGVDYGAAKKAATAATVTLNFTGTNGTVIASGTRWSTAGAAGTPGQLFQTTASATISGGVATGVPAVAVTSGVAGNVGIGTIIFPATPYVTGVATVTNPVAASGGSDAEEDEAYRTRLEQVAARDPGLDNVDHYVSVVLAQPNVGWAAVQPTWNGPDTVRVVFLNSDRSIPSGSDVSALQAIMDPGITGLGHGKAPPGDFVTVVAPTGLNVNVVIPSLVVDAGRLIADVEANIAAALAAYFATLSPGDAVLLQDVQAVIDKADGVRDFGDVTLNGSHATVATAFTQIPLPGTVTYSPAPTVYSPP